MKIKRIKLANGKSFPTTWQANGQVHVSDIHDKTNAEGVGTIVLTFARGAETIFKRAYASWYLTLLNRKGEEVKLT